MTDRYFDRELSWLAFNERVLQEAADTAVPLMERIKFLAIFSSNLDEFFRVRVASLRHLQRLKKPRKQLTFDPGERLRQIHERVGGLQEWFGALFREQILPALEAEGLVLVDEHQVDPRHEPTLRKLFREHVRPHLQPIRLDARQPPPFLVNHAIYLAVEHLSEGDRLRFNYDAPTLSIVEVPTREVARFVKLPALDGRTEILFLDDLIRRFLPELFPDEPLGPAYAFKLSRDAELYIEDEFSGDLVEKIREQLDQRAHGTPCRFLYDLRAPYVVVHRLKSALGLDERDLVMGGRYHNFSDLFQFPAVDNPALYFEPLPPKPHPVLSVADTIRDAVAERDALLHLPYQSFDPVVRFFEEAAADETAEEVWVTLYRVAADSAVVKALIAAAEAGKRVTAFVEVKARFDEAGNLYWAERMEEAGVRVLYSMPEVKVHTKIGLVGRRRDGRSQYTAYLGTGNLNEKTATLYADVGLFTADARIAGEVRAVFRMLEGETPRPSFDHLLVAPHGLRPALYDLIDTEIAKARVGAPAGIQLKMNNLEDEAIIDRLYAASQAGVPVRILARSICRLRPGVPALSETIEVRSLVGRFLEHARVYRFEHGGAPRYYAASADWMTRNLSHRVQVAFPIYADHIQRQINWLLDVQWQDTVKARILDAEQRTIYVPREPDEALVEAQRMQYDALAPHQPVADAAA